MRSNINTNKTSHFETLVSSIYLEWQQQDMKPDIQLTVGMVIAPHLCVSKSKCVCKRKSSATVMLHPLAQLNLNCQCIAV